MIKVSRRELSAEYGAFRSTELTADRRFYANLSEKIHEKRQNCNFPISETPYHRMTARRSRHGPSPTDQRYQSSDKDDDLVNKIRFYQEIMNKRAKRPSGGNTFNAGKRFDYDAWNDGHYNARNEQWTEANFRNFRSRDPFDMGGGPVPPGYPQGNPYRLRPQQQTAWRPPASAEPHLRKEREANTEQAFRQMMVIGALTFFVILALSVFGSRNDPRAPLGRLPPHGQRPREY